MSNYLTICSEYFYIYSELIVICILLKLVYNKEMIIFIFAIIPAILLFSFLNTKFIYKIFCSTAFYIINLIIAEIFSNIVFNAYCSLTDQIGYNWITDIIRIISNISDLLFIVIITAVMIYMRK